MKSNLTNLKKTTLTNPRFKKQSGVTLMELIAGLSVMAVVVVGSLALYTSATSSQKTTQLTQDASAIRAAVKQMWQGQGSFGANGTNLNNVLVSAKKVPTTIRVDTATNPNTLTHAANGTVNITSAVTAFNMAFTNIEEDLCIPLLTGAQGWLGVTVAGTAEITTFPIAPATAATACASGTTVTFRGN